MRTAPLISLGLSILVGIAAVVFGRGWLNSEADAADAPAVVVQEIETRRILVADMLIERGDLMSEATFREADWPVEHLPEGAVDSVDTLLGPDGAYPYALGVIVPGEPLLGGKLSPSAVRDTLAPLIEPGYRAVSIEVDDATGVSGFVLPDTHVDVNVFYDDNGFGSGGGGQRAITLLQNIRVLAVDQNFSENLEGASPARTVTLQVTPAQGKSLGLAAETATIGLALRPKDEVTILAPPVRRAPRRPIAAAPPKKFTQIRVIQGDAEETITAPVGRGAQNKGQN